MGRWCFAVLLLWVALGVPVPVPAADMPEWLGLQTVDIEPMSAAALGLREPLGVLVTSVQPDAAAHDAGIVKAGHATVIVHVGDMRAYHDIEVVKEPFNPFLDALKKDPGGNVVVKTIPPDGEEEDEQPVETGPENGDSQSDDTEDDSDDLDPIKIGGVPVDPDDERDSEDDLGFHKVGHEHESDNKDGPGLPGVSTDPHETALADPYDLTGTWYFVNGYYTCENPGATHISPAWAQKSVVVRIEPRKDRFVGKVVRNGVLPGYENSVRTAASCSSGPHLHQGEEVLWVERSEKDIYEGQITIDDGSGYQNNRGRKVPVIIKTMKEGGH